MRLGEQPVNSLQKALALEVLLDRILLLKVMG